jgi:hypothetical protein
MCYLQPICGHSIPYALFNTHHKTYTLIYSNLKRTLNTMTMLQINVCCNVKVKNIINVKNTHVSCRTLHSDVEHMLCRSSPLGWITICPSGLRRKDRPLYLPQIISIDKTVPVPAFLIISATCSPVIVMRRRQAWYGRCYKETSSILSDHT